MTIKIKKLITFIVIFGLNACVSASLTPELKVYEKESGYRYKMIENKSSEEDDVMLILAFSGGGTRAAAFSYGLMEALRDIRYGTKNKRLLDEVDVISSVSGGSFTSAYYALFPDSFFMEYKKVFLERNVQGDLVKAIFWPPNWFNLVSPYYDRIDMAADYYDQNIFKGKTFKDLIDKPRKPFIILNATDMSLGRRFEFTQSQFDLLCADLSDIPVARAVAASSAFPGLLSPITFENHAQKCREEKQKNFTPPSWIHNALDRDKTDSRRYFEARDLSSYYMDPKRKWIHLIDGGLADNMGLRGPYQALTTIDSDWSVMGRINKGEIKQVFVITVNAKTKTRKNWETQKGSPGLIDVFGFVATGPMDNYSMDSVEQVENYFQHKKQINGAYNFCIDEIPGCKDKVGGTMPTPNFDAVEIAFDWLVPPKDESASKIKPSLEVEKKFSDLRECLEGFDTSFKLDQKQVDLLIQVAKYLLKTSKTFNKAMSKLDSEWKNLKPDFDKDIDQTLVAQVCSLN